jgi:hypothetical protein
LAAANRPPEAIATAEKAIQVAHSIGLEPEATKIQDWLNQYRSGLQLAPGAQAPAQLLENK